jgi:protein tyrosine phosphatase (PTP) superfamily phosphohydrolase (DUF442 family)
MRARKLLVSLALGCTVLAGCRHHRPAPPAPCCPPAGRGMTIPPVGIPDGPPPPAPLPRGAAPDYGGVPTPAPPPGGELLLPQNPPPGRTRSEYPRSQYPQVMPPGRGGAILGQPDYVEPPRVIEAGPPKDDLAPSARRPAAGDRATGIPDFTQVKDGVSAGGRPELDGLDWLEARGYKSVVYVRRPGDDDTTDRRQVERRGMTFVSLLVTPDTLTKEWVDEFNRTVGDSGARPVFVYAKDPSVAGAVWYLHFRTAEFRTHDEARLRAARLGLKDETSDMFQAALKVLPKA